jgi:cyanophycinase
MGTVVLLGGGEFSAFADLDRELLERSGRDELYVLPTADAFEHPERLVQQAEAWFAALGAKAQGLPVFRRPDAQDPAIVEAVQHSRLTYLVGDSPMHLRSVLKDTPLWRALEESLAGGGVVVASSGSAMAVCDPMTDPRGGAFTLGLGLVRPLAVVPECERWSPERLHRTRKLARGFPLAELPTGSALVRDGDAWRAIGPVDIHASGQPAGLDVLPV